MVKTLNFKLNYLEEGQFVQSVWVFLDLAGSPVDHNSIKKKHLC